jgi:hypothetical protein
MKKLALTVAVVFLAACDYFGAVPRHDACHGSGVYCREGLLRVAHDGQCVCATPVVIVQ